jgi:non-ribosomal peptide synthetase component F
METRPTGVLSAGAAAAPARTLLDVLRDTCARHPEASALDDGLGALSYRELMAQVIATAARLHLAGVRSSGSSRLAQPMFRSMPTTRRNAPTWSLGRPPSAV